MHAPCKWHILIGKPINAIHGHILYICFINHSMLFDRYSWYMFPGPASAVLRHPFKSIVSPVWTISLCLVGNVLVYYMGFYTEGFYGPILYRTFYLALLYGAVLFSCCMYIHSSIMNGSMT